jgi:uncharacterized OsmC-like protein
MNMLVARHLGDDRISVKVRGHEVLVDQPVEAGGTDAGPTPVELFVASLAACVAHYARGYLHRHRLAESPIEVHTQWSMSSSPARVAVVEMQVTVPADVPAARLAGLHAVVSHCTVHNTLTSPPEVQLRVSTAEADAA